MLLLKFVFVAMTMHGALRLSFVAAIDDVLPKSFFAEYDELGDANERLEKATKLTEQAKEESSAAKVELEVATSAVKDNRKNLARQELNIHQANFHWFYGRTFLQPQLWLNGGCQGKIERSSQEKLKCEREYPSLLEAQKVATNQHTLKQKQMNVHLSELDCVKQEADRKNTMFEQAVKHNSTPFLHELYRQKQSLEYRIEAATKDAEAVRAAMSYHDAANKYFYGARSHLHSALEQQKAAECSERALADVPSEYQASGFGNQTKEAIRRQEHAANRNALIDKVKEHQRESRRHLSIAWKEINKGTGKVGEAAAIVKLVSKAGGFEDEHANFDWVGMLSDMAEFFDPHSYDSTPTSAVQQGDSFLRKQQLQADDQLRRVRSLVTELQINEESLNRQLNELEKDMMTEKERIFEEVRQYVLNGKNSRET